MDEFTIKTTSKQQVKKLFDGACFFCGESDYSLLDAHRIIEGKNGGTYNWWNTLTSCALCHRKIHTDKIVILGKYKSTRSPFFKINYIENGEEKWK